MKVATRNLWTQLVWTTVLCVAFGQMAVGAKALYTLNKNGSISHQRFSLEAPGGWTWNIIPNGSATLATVGDGKSTIVANAAWVSVDPASAYPCHGQTAPKTNTAEWIMDCAMKSIMAVTRNFKGTLQFLRQRTAGKTMKLVSFSSDDVVRYWATDHGRYLCLRFEAQAERAEKEGVVVLYKFGYECMHPKNIGFVLIEYSQRATLGKIDKKKVEQSAENYFRSLRMK